MKIKNAKRNISKILLAATLVTSIPFNSLSVQATGEQVNFTLQRPTRERPTKETMWHKENIGQAISSSDYASLYITEQNTVMSSGANSSGLLGSGNSRNREEFMNVLGPNSGKLLQDIVSVEGKAQAGLALKTDGTVWAWGSNDSGQLGDGTTTMSTRPIMVNNLPDDIVKIARGNRLGLALDADGMVWAWGGNTYGQAGIPSSSQRKLNASVVQNLTDVVDISAGQSSNNTAIALKSDGSVWWWGKDLAQSGMSHIPQKLNISNVVQISAGESHALLLCSDGTVWGWGKNSSGELGNGSTTGTLVKSNLSDVVHIEAGSENSFAIKSDGSVWVFGKNSKGELGIGNKNVTITPTNLNINDVIAIDSSNSHTIFLKTDGTLWGSGHNLYGGFGMSTPSTSLTPIKLGVINYGQPADTLAPSLTITNPKVTWVNQNIELTIQADDGENGSGVKSITLPNGEVVNSVGEKDLTLSTKYTVSRNGIYEFTVEDNAGNVSTKSINVTNIDKEKPSQPSLTKAADKLILTPSTDNLSGVDKYMYSLNNGVWTQFTGDLSLSSFVTGDHSIRIKSVDKATNESDIFSLNFTVESVSNPELDNTTDLVEKAENTKDQGDVDNARDAVNQLPEGPEKDDLNDRLDKIQDEINAEKEAEANLLAQAIAAVEKAESTKSQVDISTAYGLVNQLKPSQDKTDLLARLDALKSQIELDNALAKAIAAVVKAEETKNQLYVDVAYTLVERLPESPEKTELLRRLDELQLQIYYEADLRKATAAVVKAEKTKDDGDIDAAYVLVNALKDGQDKTDLLNRLQAIKDAIQAEKDKQANMLAEAIAAVEKAEGSKLQSDVDNARIKVNELPRGTEKTELTNRLNAVQDEIDYALKLADAIRSVERAESTESSFDISNAYKKVNGLKDGETKTDLLNRLKAIEQKLAQKAEDDRIAKEAIKAVERAELTKKPIDIESAKSKVALVKDEVLREELEERLLAIELAQEEVKEAENLKEAERLVRLAEIFKRNPHLMNAKTAVSKLSTSEAKLALQARLDAIEGKNGSGVITEEMKKEMTAESTVEKAEKYKYAPLIRKAIAAVDGLPESPKKQELQERINKLLEV